MLLNKQMKLYNYKSIDKSCIINIDLLIKGKFKLNIRRRKTISLMFKNSKDLKLIGQKTKQNSL